jgi:hypothetical protein
MPRGVYPRSAEYLASITARIQAAPKRQRRCELGCECRRHAPEVRERIRQASLARGGYPPRPTPESITKGAQTRRGRPRPRDVVERVAAKNRGQRRTFEPSYHTVHSRVQRRLKVGTCELSDGTCRGRLEMAVLWYDTPWEFLRHASKVNSAASCWYSVRDEDYAVLCNYHHRHYDKGELFVLGVTLRERRTSNEQVA